MIIRSIKILVYDSLTKSYIIAKEATNYGTKMDDDCKNNRNIGLSIFLSSTLSIMQTKKILYELLLRTITTMSDIIS